MQILHIVYFAVTVRFSSSYAARGTSLIELSVQDSRFSNKLSDRVAILLPKILSDLQHIIVDVSTTNAAEEEINRFFLQQDIRPKLTSANCRWKSDLNNTYGIVTSLENLIGSQCSFHRSVVYIFTMDSEANQHTSAEILETARHHWQYFEIYKMFFVSLESVKVFYPFKLESGNRRGTIEEMKMTQNEQIDKNLHGHPLRVQLFSSIFSTPIINKTTQKIVGAEGADAKVMLLLQRRMNFSLQLQDPDPNYFGFSLPNGSFTGGIGLLMRNETDAVITGYFIKDYKTRDFEFTVGVYDDKLCVYCPKSDRIPPSILPLFSIGYDMWISYVLVAFGSGTILSLFYWANVLNFDFVVCGARDVFQFYIDTWIVWVRVGLVKLPTFKSGRIFLLSLSVVSVIFGAIFESSLATVYTKPLYYPDVNTLKQLSSKGYKILYRFQLFKDDLFPKNISATYDALDAKMVLVKEQNLMEQMALRRNYASVSRYYVFQISDSFYFTRKILHVVPECPKLYMISYALQKRSVYAEQINKLLLEIVAGGLLNHWIEMMKTKEMLSHIAKPNTDSPPSGVKVLSLRDLQLSFYVLLMGSLLGGLVLGLEFCKAYANRRKIKAASNIRCFREKRLQIFIQVKK